MDKSAFTFRRTGGVPSQGRVTTAAGNQATATSTATSTATAGAQGSRADISFIVSDVDPAVAARQGELRALMPGAQGLELPEQGGGAWTHVTAVTAVTEVTGPEPGAAAANPRKRGVEQLGGREEEHAAKKVRGAPSEVVVIPDDPSAVLVLKTQGDAFTGDTRKASLAHAQRTAEWIRKAILDAAHQDAGRRPGPETASARMVNEIALGLQKMTSTHTVFTAFVRACCVQAGDLSVAQRNKLFAASAASDKFLAGEIQLALENTPLGSAQAPVPSKEQFAAVLILAQGRYSPGIKPRTAGNIWTSVNNRLLGVFHALDQGQKQEMATNLEAAIGSPLYLDETFAADVRSRLDPRLLTPGRDAQPAHATGPTGLAPVGRQQPQAVGVTLQDMTRLISLVNTLRNPTIDVAVYARAAQMDVNVVRGIFARLIMDLAPRYGIFLTSHNCADIEVLNLIRRTLHCDRDQAELFAVRTLWPYLLQQGL